MPNKIPRLCRQANGSKFKLSYSGWMKAGNATLEVSETTYANKPVYRVVAKGWTTGPIKWVFKVQDHYESYFDKQTGRLISLFVMLMKAVM